MHMVGQQSATALQPYDNATSNDCGIGGAISVATSAPDTKERMAEEQQCPTEPEGSSESHPNSDAGIPRRRHVRKAAMEAPKAWRQ